MPRTLKGDMPENEIAKPYREPAMTLSRRIEMNRAGDAHRDANPSDPFARDRAMTYMKRGLELPSDVYSDATSRLAARRPA